MSLIPDQNGVIESAVEPVKNRRKYWLNTTTGKMYILKNNKYELMENEVITNSNGTAIKFPDGIMICKLNITVTDQAIDTLYSSGLTFYRGVRIWTFPVAFIDIPNVICDSFKWGTSGSWGTTNGKPTMTDTMLVGMDLFPRATGTVCYIEATAIGRWK